MGSAIMASGQPVYLYVQVGLCQIWQKSLHKAWSSIDLWPQNRITSSLSATGTKYVYVKTVRHTFLDDFFFFLELKFEHIFLSSLLNKTAGLCQI